MPSAAVEAAFRSRIEANWTQTVVLGINGVTEPPSDGRSFLIVQYPVSNSSRPVVSKKRWEEGAARIVLNVQGGTGLPDGLALADTIADLFRGDHLVFDGVEVFEPSAPIVNDQNDDGNYFELSVIVPYRYQFDAT